MKPPPTQIDNADVLEYAWSDKPFGVVRYTDGSIADTIHGIAICKYPSSDSVYRFSCDKYWKTSQDAEYSSIEEAKRMLPEQYKNAPVHWRKPQAANKELERTEDRRSA